MVWWLALFVLCAAGSPAAASGGAAVGKSRAELCALSSHAQEHWDKIAAEFELINPANIVDQPSAAVGINYFTRIAPLHISNNGVVNVSFFSSTPASSDWIAAYSPASVNIHTTVPVKFGFADADPDYLSTGAGLLRFNLTNLRSDVKFYFFKGNLTKPIFANSSAVNVSFINPNEPLRPRLVATGNLDELNLLWSSASSADPVLKWGLESGKYNVTAPAKTSSIPQSSMCGRPANGTGWRDLGLIHTAPLSGMAALSRRKLFYIFGDAASGDFSREHTLIVPPQPGKAAGPTTAVLFCDLGRGSTDDTFTWNEYGRPALNTSNSVAARVERGEVDAIFHGGDISYAVGYEAVWDFFLNMISGMASGSLYLTTVGNHESDWPNSASYYTGTDSGGECGVATTRLLPQPVAAGQSPANQPWWSYSVGLMHFVGLSSEHNYTVGSAQYKWLEADLQAVDRNVTPWVVLNLHRAMYINSNFGGPVYSDLAVSALMIANLEPLLWKYRVNLAFYGHNHVMQRQAAVFNSQVVQASQPRQVDGETVAWHSNPQATVHLVVGSAGAGFTVNAVTPPPAWNELTMYVYGYVVATAANASYLSWQFVSSDTGEVLDRVVITQDAEQPWVLPDSSGSGSGSGDDGSAASNLYWLFLLLVVPVVLVPAWLYLRHSRASAAAKSRGAYVLWDEKEAPLPLPPGSQTLTESLMPQGVDYTEEGGRKAQVGAFREGGRRIQA